MSRETRAFEFDRFLLEIGERRLTRDGHPVRLRGKVFETLGLLVRNHGRLVTKEELIAAVWPDSLVEESNLNHNICVLRRALGEKPSGQKYIETVPRQGYRFIAEVKELQPTAEPRAALAWDAPEQRLPSEVPLPDLMPAQLDLDFGSTSSNSHGRLLLSIRSRRFYSRVLVTLLLISSVLAIFAIGVQRFGHSTRIAPPRTLMAVLPFEILTADSRDRHIADGFTEEIISELGRFNPGRLGVIGRTTSKTYDAAGKSVAQIGRELGVDHVVEGSVRRDGNQVRVTVLLVRVSDQAHLWAGKYDGDVGSILNMQVEVTKQIVREIGNRIAADSGATSRRSEPSPIEPQTASNVI